MSDFFASLATRARNSVEGAVLPRLPSRFETPESDLAAVPDALLEVHAHNESPAPVSRAAARRAAPTDVTEATIPSAPPVRRSSAVPSQPEPPLDRSTDAKRPVKETAPTVAPRNPAVATLALPTAQKLASVPSGDLDDHSHSPIRVETVRERVVERELVERASSPVTLIAKRSEGKSENGKQQEPRIREAARRAPEVVPNVARAVAVPKAPTIEPRVVRAARERSVSATPARTSETVVHVSIGRVEVRAVTPSAERRREPASSSVMSLAEYLSSQAERAR